MPQPDSHVADPTGAVNQAGLRDQNARVVLSFIRRNGAMPGAEIARRSGLSAQTVSNITRALEADNLLRRGEAVKGKVGKPSVPVMLNPKGVHALGLSLGRRSSELMLVDFLGNQIETVSTAYSHPTIDSIFSFLQNGMDVIFAKHPAARANTTGIGVAVPGKIWDWLEIVHAPEDVMRKWRDLDIKTTIAQQTGLDVYVENDATSACVAEQLLGQGGAFSDFAYIFIGAFIGGGLVLNGKVFSGRTGNAAAFGPMPVADGRGGTTELLSVASLHVLETILRNDGLDPRDLRRNPTDWSFCQEQVDVWVQSTSQRLAVAIASIMSVVEVEAVLIDGAMPGDVAVQVTEMTRRAFDDLDITLIERPAIHRGQVGRNARALGAALLPIHARYFAL